MTDIGAYVVPCMVLVIIGYGMFRKVPVLDTFLSGASGGMRTMVRLLPTLVGFITAVTMFQSSGALDMLMVAFRPVADFMGTPVEVIPLALLHPISGGGATAILSDLFTRYGPDSYIGRVASVMCGSDETTFYAVTVYYGSVGVNRARHTLLAALVADFSVVISSAFVVSFLL